jgi:hypothetical protein
MSQRSLKAGFAATNEQEYSMLGELRGTSAYRQTLSPELSFVLGSSALLWVVPVGMPQMVPEARVQIHLAGPQPPPSYNLHTLFVSFSINS